MYTLPVQYRADSKEGGSGQNQQPRHKSSNKNNNITDHDCFPRAPP